MIERHEVVQIIKDARATGRQLQLRRLKARLREGWSRDEVQAVLDEMFLIHLGRYGDVEVSDYVLTPADFKPKRTDLTEMLKKHHGATKQPALHLYEAVNIFH